MSHERVARVYRSGRDAERFDALADDAIVLLENKWKTHPDTEIRKQWSSTLEALRASRYQIVEVPMEAECAKIVEGSRRGKNMFALGMLSWLYQRDLSIVKAQIAHQFRKKSAEIHERNVELVEAGYGWAQANLEFRIEVPTVKGDEARVVMNGNEALGMGAIAAGMELCSMYPITPATSASHFLSEVYDKFGGVVHQAEDEIAAVGRDRRVLCGKDHLTCTDGANNLSQFIEERMPRSSARRSGRSEESARNRRREIRPMTNPILPQCARMSYP